VFFGVFALLLAEPDGPAPEAPWTYRPEVNENPVATAPVVDVTAPVEEVEAPVAEVEAPVADAP
jgi:hypothetical protein